MNAVIKKPYTRRQLTQKDINKGREERKLTKANNLAYEAKVEQAIKTLEIAAKDGNRPLPEFFESLRVFQPVIYGELFRRMLSRKLPNRLYLEFVKFYTDLTINIPAKLAADAGLMGILKTMSPEVTLAILTARTQAERLDLIEEAEVVGE